MEPHGAIYADSVGPGATQAPQVPMISPPDAAPPPHTHPGCVPPGAGALCVCVHACVRVCEYRANVGSSEAHMVVALMVAGRGRGPLRARPGPSPGPAGPRPGPRRAWLDPGLA